MYRILSLITILALLASPALAAPTLQMDDRLGYAAGEIVGNYDEFHQGYAYTTLTTAVTLHMGTSTAQAVYPFPATAAVVKLSSGDANDTGAVILTYLDENWDRQVETITLTGQTQATSVATPIRVLELECVNSGAQDTTNQGIIYCYTGAATSGVPNSLATVLALIPIGRGRSVNAVASLPRNVTRAVIREVNVAPMILREATTETSLNATVYLNVRDSTQTYPVTHRYGPFGPGRTEVLVPVDDKHDVWLTEGGLSVRGVPSIVSAGFSLFYRK